MEQARILHIEDSEDIRRSVESILSVRGTHKVIASAETVGEAWELLEAIKDKRLEANVILLDGHLKGGAYLNHPKVIRDKMKELVLNLPVIGLSGEGLTEKGLVIGQDIDVDLRKTELSKDIRLLERVLDELPEPEEKL
jgi:DNA-binding NtrC family response regulator